MHPVLAPTPRASAATGRGIAICAAAAAVAAALAGCGSSNHSASSASAPTVTTPTSLTQAAGSTTAPAGNGGHSGPTCPSAASIGTVMGTTYTGPQTQGGPGAGTTTCTYLTGATPALTLTYYPTGTPLKVLTAGASGPLSPMGAGGTELTDASGQIRYVSRSIQPSIKIVDHVDAQGLDPTQLTQLLRVQ